MILRTHRYEAEHKDGNVVLTLPDNTVFSQNMDRVAYKMIEHAVLNLFTPEQREQLLKTIKGELE